MLKTLRRSISQLQCQEKLGIESDIEFLLEQWKYFFDQMPDRIRKITIKES